jgi:hypothetical protein
MRRAVPLRAGPVTNHLHAECKQYRLVTITATKDGILCAGRWRCEQDPSQFNHQQCNAQYSLVKFSAILSRLALWYRHAVLCLACLEH